VAEPKICPHCEQEMDEDLAELNICSECGQEFTDCDLEEAEEKRREENEDSSDEENEGEQS